MAAARAPAGGSSPRVPRGRGDADVVRVGVAVRGAVQGVGFRPFVFRLARDLGLAGFVTNDGAGVRAELEGPRAAVDDAVARLRADAPPRATVRDVAVSPLAPEGAAGFEIRPSERAGPPTATVLADAATCPACLAEVLDPTDRRARYPFGSCTHCGPRFTIVTGLPYDRARTTMAGFPLCPACRAEYDDPLDRRFHAQPIACPACGPRLALLDAGGAPLVDGDAALRAAAAALDGGAVVAALGLGGFHLLVDARSEAAVARLRARKHREGKPLALLVRDLDAARAIVEVDDLAAALLASPEAPIVLLPRRADAPAGASVAPSVAPGSGRLGVMLPATPLHHLLARGVEGPLVATSGNRSDEPICTSPAEAVTRLAGLADLFLVHDRPVARPLDDSVVAVAGDLAFPVRRGRGHAPLPVAARRPGPTVLALGGHQKVALALALGDEVFGGPHVGDLDSAEALDAFHAAVRDLLALYDARPAAIAHDLHPDYATTRFAEDLAASPLPWARALADVPRVAVQHHHAHLAACAAEHGLEGPLLAATWDGTGLGSDGTIWGGEVLLGDARACTRVATLSAFRLPGGDAAARAPWRAAAGVLFGTRGPAALDDPALAAVPAADRGVVGRMLATGVHAPLTSSAGRLFDAVAALLGVRTTCSYEGQAAMELEALAAPGDHGTYPVVWDVPATGPRVLALGPLVEALLDDRRRGAPVAIMAAKIHATLAEALVTLARQLAAPRLALTGGCWQNVRLLAATRARLAAAGIEAVVHRRVPPGDGGLALGQAAVASARLGA
ncbi:MAG: carbamoyltransferase HypF [Planctomycetia bacterium]|nr:carbamoyltransferase HypF [Planctomycetia bacterium]